MSESVSYMLVSRALRSYPQYAMFKLGLLDEAVVRFMSVVLILSYCSHNGHEAIGTPSKPC